MTYALAQASRLDRNAFTEPKIKAPLVAISASGRSEPQSVPVAGQLRLEARFPAALISKPARCRDDQNLSQSNDPHCFAYIGGELFNPRRLIEGRIVPFMVKGVWD